jgi:hypothetical protein
VRELQPGLSHWEARHPDWTPEQGRTPEQSGSTGWGPEVSSYTIDDSEQLLLFDPLAVPSEIEELAAGRETTIVLTCPWHQRDAPVVAERLGIPIYLPPPEQAGPSPVEGHVFSAGERALCGPKLAYGRRIGIGSARPKLRHPRR